MNFLRKPATTHQQACADHMRLVRLLLLALAMPCALAAQSTSIPQGWFKAGTAPQEYDVGTDDAVHRGGAASAYVRFVAAKPTPRGFCTLMQTIAADDYRGTRIRLSGYLRGAGIKDEAGLWLRIDGPQRSRPLGFGNTQSRLVPGAEWARADIVLDVPTDATSINFGLLLAGEGQVWVDDLELVQVSRDVPTTGVAPRLPSSPLNLDFERKVPPRKPTTNDR